MLIKTEYTVIFNIYIYMYVYIYIYITSVEVNFYRYLSQLTNNEKR